MQLFVDNLNKDLEAIISIMKDQIIIIAGNFNKLDATLLCPDFGLVSIVDAPMRGSNVLDQVFVNHPGVYKSFFLKSGENETHGCISYIQTNQQMQWSKFLMQ